MTKTSRQRVKVPKEQIPERLFLRVGSALDKEAQHGKPVTLRMWDGLPYAEGAAEWEFEFSWAVGLRGSGLAGAYMLEQAWAYLDVLDEEPND